MERNKLLSVIIPVYNTEKWLKRCLDSILAQSYRNLEVICVNDASPDGCSAILEKYAAGDSRIKIINHEKNRGLFAARMTGIKQAKGAYIAFVDSDDFISCDWFYPLIRKAVNENADMVLGNTVNIAESGQMTYYNNYRRFNSDKQSVIAPELLRVFFKQHGECFIWHTVWNKVYSKKMIERCLPYLEKMSEPLIMGEDIAFSSVFYAFSDKLAFCDNDCYFYYRHSEASTSVRLPREKIIKNLEDIIRVFDFVENFLKEIEEYRLFEEDFAAFKEQYRIIWSGNIAAAGLQNDGSVKNLFAKGFGSGSYRMPSAHSFYFYEISTTWDDRLEQMKQHILTSHAEYISFDIFDTLIVRPLWSPDDLLRFVAEECAENFCIPENFREMRRIAEEDCRKIHKAADRNCEDVTLAEIYDYLTETFKIETELASRLMAKENELEIKFSSARRCGAELYDLALRAGKKVVFISDMYLSEEVVAAVLNKNGYQVYERIFVSSEYKKLKATGALFKSVLNSLHISPNNIVHIGDNKNSDIEKANANGIEALWIPKAIDVFTNKFSDFYTGDSFKEIYCGNNQKIDSKGVIEQLPLRCMFSVVANHMFDNPFRPFNSRTLYNADAYYIGYMALGMHIFGLAKWIYDKALAERYETVHFLARDGYVVKQAFDIIAATMEKKNGIRINSSYFYATREALYPFMIRSREDVFKLVGITDYKCHTPAEILNWFRKICKEISVEDVSEYRKHGIDLDRPFETINDFIGFLSAMSEISLDLNKAGAYQNDISKKMQTIFAGNCATFDIGYSGRLQSILSGLAQKPIDVFYVHGNGYETTALAEKNGFKVHCFYDFSPTVSAILRETFISDSSPSCIGYSLKDNSLSFEFDEMKDAYSETYAIREMHRGAVNFCKDLTALYADYLHLFTCRPQDISAAFENFILNATPLDCQTFNSTCITDKMYSGYVKKSFLETLFWTRDNIASDRIVYIDRTFRAKSKLGRALFYFLFDNKTFRKKIKARLKHQDK